MNLNDRLKIEEMEEKYDSFKPRINALVEAIDDFQKRYEDYVKLREFYGSEDWFRLSEQTENNLKCGVLSEDQLFDFIGEHNELVGQFLDMSSQMYRHL
ncbi:TPA: DUF4298 domain-containing protein [Streptococcus agalactiae]